ncbi:MAG: type II secretion system major pseudopilin GspG [Spirochaetes bacterium]|nr:type II secretion system major pseudopilin GspG [Spirochaetota bacterium]
MKLLRPNHTSTSLRLSGVTLAEVLIVIVILTTLALLIVPRLAGKTEKARRAAAVLDVERGIPAALDEYEADCGRYPTTEQGLEALVAKPTNSPVPQNWQGPYLKKKTYLDPWGRKYNFRSPSTRAGAMYDLFSFGPDGKEGGEGADKDIGNWE